MPSRRQDVRPRIAKRAILPAALLLGSAAFPAIAQSDGDRAALMERIRLLEQRLEQLERAPQRASRPAPGRPVAAPAPAAPVATAPAPPPSAPAEPAARLRDPREEDIPQEAFVFRDQAVTLRPGKAELSLDLGYLRDRRTVSTDRSGSAVLTGRVGLLDGVEAAITLPFFIATRSFELSPTFVTDRETRAMGDVTAQVNIRGWGEREYRPGAVFTAALVTPTGPSPFVNPAQGITPQQVPVDITQFISTRAAWALRGGVQMFKTMDPLVLFGGVAYEYAFPVEQSGITFRPGWRISYNAGVSFALSDRSTLGFTFIGNYTAALQANSIQYRATASEAAVFRLSLVQRLAPGLWIEPSLGMGLVSESPNVQVGLGLRYRF
ncbi:hypothetical protein [Sediminicoccus sp. BL-A-41-H5]|jgi:hypothetical protein|uniref:hypothetical protein n=1 Tax=Sediminicoccus sp. BL-A-41-H5 TaxID=3421106 RepID=UPI003D66B288